MSETKDGGPEKACDVCHFALDGPDPSVPGICGKCYQVWGKSEFAADIAKLVRFRADGGKR